jgi:hypothetical protein
MTVPFPPGPWPFSLLFYPRLPGSGTRSCSGVAPSRRLDSERSRKLRRSRKHMANRRVLRNVATTGSPCRDFGPGYNSHNGCRFDWTEPLVVFLSQSNLSDSRIRCLSMAFSRFHPGSLITVVAVMVAAASMAGSASACDSAPRSQAVASVRSCCASKATPERMSRCGCCKTPRSLARSDRAPSSPASSPRLTGTGDVASRGLIGVPVSDRDLRMADRALRCVCEVGQAPQSPLRPPQQTTDPRSNSGNERAPAGPATSYASPSPAALSFFSPACSNQPGSPREIQTSRLRC